MAREAGEAGQFHLLVSALKVRDETLAARKILLAIEDITERKQNTEALQAAKRQPIRRNELLASIEHALEYARGMREALTGGTIT
jgi:hypothetical protein